jgi:hypothetical protein
MSEPNVHYELHGKQSYERSEGALQWLRAEQDQQAWLRAEQDEQEWLRTQQENCSGTGGQAS